MWQFCCRLLTSIRPEYSFRFRSDALGRRIPESTPHRGKGRRLGLGEETHEPNRLMLGVKFADGLSAIAGRYYSGVAHRKLRDEPLTPSLTIGAGVGGPLRAPVQYWVRPLPCNLSNFLGVSILIKRR